MTHSAFDPVAALPGSTPSDVFELLRRDLSIDPHPLDPRRLDAIVSDLERFYGRPLTELADREIKALQEANHRAQEALSAAVDETTLNQYYASTMRYVFGNLYLEAARDYQAEYRLLALACRKLRVRRALDFGGGAGGLCLSLWSAGVACDYLDVAGPTLDFAVSRFRNRGLTPRVYTSDEPLPADTYDAVFAKDVFEHLWDVEGAVRKIADVLRPGGYLINDSTFARDQQHDHLEKNLVYADLPRWNALLARYQLWYQGRLKPDQVSRLLRKLGWSTATLGVRVSPRVKHGGNFLLHGKQA